MHSPPLHGYATTIQKPGGLLRVQGKSLRSELTSPVNVAVHLVSPGVLTRTWAIALLRSLLPPTLSKAWDDYRGLYSDRTCLTELGILFSLLILSPRMSAGNFIAGCQQDRDCFFFNVAVDRGNLQQLRRGPKSRTAYMPPSSWIFLGPFICGVISNTFRAPFRGFIWGVVKGLQNTRKGANTVEVTIIIYYTLSGMKLASPQRRQVSIRSGGRTLSLQHG